MADSLLSTKVKSTPPDNKAKWGETEAAIEVLKDLIQAITITIDPGNVVIGTVTANAGTNLNTSALATQTTLASILSKIVTAPALEGGNLATLAAVDFATQTTLAAILAKIIAAPATEATLALVKVKTDNLDVALSTRLKPADTLAAVTAVTAITNALPAGTNNIGKVSPPTGTKVNSTAYETGHVLKNAAGILVYVSGYNSGPTQFIQLHDSTTVPADTAVPVKIISVPATSNFSIDIPLTGLAFATGIAVCNSSTGPAKTVGSADCFFTAVVI